MNADEIVQHILSNGTLPFFQAEGHELQAVIDRLKAESDRYWRIDPNISLQFAKAIVQIGETTNNLSVVALGTMVTGDAFRQLDLTKEAWEKLNEAGLLYQKADDEIGWARTRGGILTLCVDFNQADAGIADAEIAITIFRKHNQIESLARLQVNIAGVYNLLGQYQNALEKCREALDIARLLGEAGRNRLSVIYFNMGNANLGLGNLEVARDYYQKSREIMAANGETIGVALADLNLINIAQAQGQNKLALRLLHDTVDVLAPHHAMGTGKEIWHLIECYLFLNRFIEARDLAEQTISQQAKNTDTRDTALILIQLAAAQSALGNFDRVYPALERAAKIFDQLQAVGWLGITYLYHGQAAMRQGSFATAKQDAVRAAEYFEQNGQEFARANALLLSAQIDFLNKDCEIASQTATQVLTIANKLNIANLKYGIHLLLGKLAEQNSQTMRAIRHYQVATWTIERIQRSLVLTSRPDFLADKQESIQLLLRLQLSSGQIEAAFTTLERAKAQVWLSYLSQLDQLHWLTDKPATQALIQELNRLREEHHWYYRLAYDEFFRQQHHAGIAPELAAQEAQIRERRLRSLTEQLYLQSSLDDLAVAPVMPLSEIQRYLTDTEQLVAYYSDGHTLWAFVLDASHIEAYELPEPVSAVEEVWNKLQNNINRALRTVPGSSEEKSLAHFARILGKRLYDALMRPFERILSDCQQLTVVPYGFLHYVPFHLLHDDEGYLVEQHELRVLPTASLITRQPPQQARCALGIAYSADNRLQHAGSEALDVVSRFGGRLYVEADAKQTILSTPPCQILHIAAHGQYRIDQPDFSFIQLVDGPIFTDDLFQHDLRYELVTLSACETGRSRATAGDELIGLGRGFLFAGAGALIASLWPVDDALTLELMNRLYHQLDIGASKSAALREAQLHMTRTYSGLHPAFWGAFQLIGSARPLSK